METTSTRNIAIAIIGVAVVGFATFFAFKSSSKPAKVEIAPNPEPVEEEDCDEWLTEEEEENEPVVKKNLYERKATGFNRNLSPVEDFGDDEDE